MIENQENGAGGTGPRTFPVRGQRVMLDEDVAMLCSIGIEELNLAVARSMDRFPEGLVLRLNPEELAGLKSHFAIPDREAHHVFTGQGLAFFSSFLLELQEGSTVGESCAPTCGCRK